MAGMLAAREVDSIREKFKPYDIRETINILYPRTLYPHLKRCSVLVPLFFRNGQWRVLLTIRSHKLKNHTGDVSFPGGVGEKTDTDDVITALREAKEEIGLQKQDVVVVAVLHPCFLSPNNMVFSVVGVIHDDFVPKPNCDEVAKVFDLPLEQFLSGGKTQYWNCFGREIQIPFFSVTVGSDNIDVWGFTALICECACYVVFNIKKRTYILTRPTAGDDHAFADFEFVFHHLCQNIKARL